jgi:hypothetical protein
MLRDSNIVENRLKPMKIWTQVIFLVWNAAIRWYSALGTEYSAETEYSVPAKLPNIRFWPKLKIPVSVDHYLLELICFHNLWPSQIDVGKNNTEKGC